LHRELRVTVVVIVVVIVDAGTSGDDEEAQQTCRRSDDGYKSNERVKNKDSDKDRGTEKEHT
jgi:hypothetical protein